MDSEQKNLLEALAKKALELSGPSKKELEKYCWMVLHEYRHGVFPVEYDIREIDEKMYISVLKLAKGLSNDFG